MNSELPTSGMGTAAVVPEKSKEPGKQIAPGLSASPPAGDGPKIEVALLTGGGDRPYAFGLATELIAKGIFLDIIGSDDLECPELRDRPSVRFLNLRGGQNSDASFPAKISRVLAYYLRLLHYATHSKPKLFHVLWNNKFEFFDRTLLMVYYRMLGKRVVLTVHNVNAAKRDSRDTILNRLTLRIQYRLAHHLFAHSEKMKTDLIQEFGLSRAKVTTIPFGINNSVPNTNLTTEEARRRLGIARNEKAILFFGNIAPYKGVEYLLSAFQKFLPAQQGYRLIIAGRPKGFPEYWERIEAALRDDVVSGRILLRSDYIPDGETEVFFKAADVFVLPYRYIYQSGVLFLGYSFGLPVLAADVGALKEEIVEGESGFVFKPEDPFDLARAIQAYFQSDLYRNLESKRTAIRDYAAAQHSWGVVGEKTRSIYGSLLATASTKQWSHRAATKAF